MAQGSFEDSLLNVVKHTKDDKTRSKLYVELSYDQLGRSYEQALEYGRSALAAAKRSNDKQQIASAYLSITYVYNYGGHYDEGLAVVDTALAIATSGNYKEQHYWAEYMLSSIHRRKASYNMAVTHAMNALSIAEELNDNRLLGSSYNTIGILYLNLGNISKSKQYHLKALAIREHDKDSVGISISLNNIGIVFRDEGDYNKALAYYFKALAIAIHRDDSEDISFLYNDIGAAYTKVGNLDSAEVFLKRSIDIRERTGDKSEIAYTYNYLGENYEKKSDLAKAELYIKKALNTAIAQGNNKQHYEALESLSDFYARNKIYDSAYTYLRAYRFYKDTIASTENQSLIAELTTKYETEKKEKKILIQEAALNRKNYMIGGITALLIIALLSGYFYYNSYKLRQKDMLQKAIIQQQELATKAVIEAEEKERKRIAAELHDGVGQLMSAARMNLNAVRNEIPFQNNDQQDAFDKAISLVDEGCKEVRSVSHNIMPNALLKAGLVSAIREFVEKIDYRTLEVNLYSEGLNENIPTNVETVLYRVIQECVNNVIKHAQASKLDITLIRDEDGISATVEDNGIGFDTKRTSDGLGMKNMQTRIDYLKGSIEWNSATDKGTVVMIQIPATEIK